MSCELRRCVYVLVAVSTLGLVTGCSSSKSPLSDIATSKPDSDLVGTWYFSKVDGDGKQQEFYFRIGNSGDVAPSHGYVNFGNKKSSKVLYKNLMRISLIEDKGKEIESTQYIFFTTKIGKMRFANVPAFSEDNNISNCLLCKYEVSGNQLILWGMDSEKVIEKSELKGKATGFLTFKLTDTAENIVRYLKRGGDKTLFPDSGKFVCRRVKPTKKRD